MIASKRPLFAALGLSPLLLLFASCGGDSDNFTSKRGGRGGSATGGGAGDEGGAPAGVTLLAILPERVLVARFEILLVRFRNLPLRREMQVGIEPHGSVRVRVVARPLEPAALGELLIRHS